MFVKQLIAGTVNNSIVDSLQFLKRRMYTFCKTMDASAVVDTQNLKIIKCV